MKLIYGRGYVYSIQYHIVWCVKYRHEVLIGEIKESLYNIICKISDDNNVEIVELSINKDHVHLLISCSPQHYIPNLMKAFKGVSARLLMKRHRNTLKERLYGGNLWNPSYFVATVSKNTEEQIIEYIKSQKIK